MHSYLLKIISIWFTPENRFIRFDSTVEADSFLTVKAPPYRVDCKIDNSIKLVLIAYSDTYNDKLETSKKNSDIEIMTSATV